MAQKGSFDSERRSAKRFLVSLPVETDRGPGVTRDVSVSGLYLVAEKPLDVGDHIELTLSAPDPDYPESSLPLQLRVKGRVVRVEEEDGAVGAGIALDEGSRYLVQALVEETADTAGPEVHGRKERVMRQGADVNTHRTARILQEGTAMSTNEIDRRTRPKKPSRRRPIYLGVAVVVVVALVVGPLDGSDGCAGHHSSMARSSTNTADDVSSITISPHHRHRHRPSHAGGRVLELRQHRGIHIFGHLQLRNGTHGADLRPRSSQGSLGQHNRYAAIYRLVNPPSGASGNGDGQLLGLRRQRHRGRRGQLRRGRSEHPVC